MVNITYDDQVTYESFKIKFTGTCACVFQLFQLEITSLSHLPWSKLYTIVMCNSNSIPGSHCQRLRLEGVEVGYTFADFISLTCAMVEPIGHLGAAELQATSVTTRAAS